MRDRVLKELERRYNEAMTISKTEIDSPEKYSQFLTSIAHYMQHAKSQALTKKIINKLVAKSKSVGLGKVLNREAAKNITQLKKDLKRVTNIAKKRNLPITFNESEVSGRLSTEQIFGLRMSELASYLTEDHPDPNSLTTHLGNMRFVLQFLETKGTLKKNSEYLTSAQYDTLQSEYSKKLKQRDVFSNFTRLDDYTELESIRKYVYQEATRDEALLFIVSNYDLIDESNTKKYEGLDINQGREKADEYSRHLQRIHNHITNEIEKTPILLKVGRWSLEHLVPTIVSLIITFAIYIILLKVFGLNIAPDVVRDWIK